MATDAPQPATPAQRRPAPFPCPTLDDCRHVVEAGRDVIIDLLRDQLRSEATERKRLAEAQSEERRAIAHEQNEVVRTGFSELREDLRARDRHQSRLLLILVLGVLSLAGWQAADTLLPGASVLRGAEAAQALHGTVVTPLPAVAP